MPNHNTEKIKRLCTDCKSRLKDNEIGICEKCKNKPKEKKLYTVIADAVIPIKVRYTVLAEDEHEAAKLIKNNKYKTISVEQPKIRTNNLIQLAIFIGNSINKVLSIRLK